MIEHGVDHVKIDLSYNSTLTKLAIFKNGYFLIKKSCFVIVNCGCACIVGVWKGLLTTK
jgi:hypothetical protein